MLELLESVVLEYKIMQQWSVKKQRYNIKPDTVEKVLTNSAAREANMGLTPPPPTPQEATEKEKQDKER